MIPLPDASIINPTYHDAKVGESGIVVKRPAPWGRRFEGPPSDFGGEKEEISCRIRVVLRAGWVFAAC